MSLPQLDCPFTEADVRAAQNVIDSWDREEPVTGALMADPESSARALLRLRGIVAQVVSDARYAGYVEGIQQGRKQIGRLVHDALTDEGV